MRFWVCYRFLTSSDQCSLFTHHMASQAGGGNINFDLHHILPLSTVTPIKTPSETHVFHSYIQNTHRCILKFKINEFEKRPTSAKKLPKIVCLLEERAESQNSIWPNAISISNILVRGFPYCQTEGRSGSSWYFTKITDDDQLVILSFS